MGKVFACFSIALHNFKKWAVNPRLYILLLIEVLYLHSRLSPVGELCVRTGYKVTPYLLPFLLDEGSAVMMLFLGVVLLFCDAPFIEDEQPYIMLRSGRRIWFIGQMLYIVVASVLYLIVLYFISVLVLLPHIEWSAEWGKLLSTFSQTSAAGQNGISIPFARVITARFDPIPAVLRCVVNGSLVATVLGMLMFFVNLNISRTAGGICGTALVLWNMVTYKTCVLVCEYLAGLVGEPFPCGLRRQLDIPEPYVYFVGTVGFVCGFVGHFVGDAAQAEH